MFKKRDSQRGDNTANVKTLTSDHVATFDSLMYHIPVGSVIGVGVCFDKEPDNTITAKKHYLGSYLNAVVNTVNGLVQENKCHMFFTLIADTLTAANTGDSNLTMYQAAGAEYLDKNARFFSINLQAKFIEHTQWEEWRNDFALARLIALFSTKKRSDSREHRSNSFEPKSQTEKVHRKEYAKSLPNESTPPFLSSPETSPQTPKLEKTSTNSPPATPFEDFKSFFDDTSVLAERKAFEKIEPTFKVALQYVEHMYSVTSPNHKEFKKSVDEVVGEYVRITVNQLKQRDKMPDEQINSDSLVRYMRTHLLEECAQYIETGIIARKYQKPIRFLHEGNNKAFQFIEKVLVGQLPSGVLALQIVDLQFVQSKKATKFLDEHPTFFNPRRSPDTNSKKNRTPMQGTAVSVPPANVIINVSIYLQRPETSQDDIKNMMTLLAPAIQAKQKRGATSKSEGSKATYAFSSPRPAFDELVAHLLKFFYSEDTTLEALQAFQTFLENRLDLLLEPEELNERSFN